MTTQFSINGTPYTVNLEQLPADISLNTFIREHAGLPATKFMCQEGGCGVCVCVVTSKQPGTNKTRTWAVNSCLTLLNSCADWQIVTSEGLGNKRIGYHPIQKRLAAMHGTQCGYCSPGFVMNMFGLLEANDGKLTMEQIENSFGGNICRCTGYRPILDAMKSFAVDSNIEVPAECRDIEDLGAKLCPKSGAPCSGTCKSAPKRFELTYPDGNKWFWPQSLAEVFKAFEQVEAGNYMLVAGNTAHGVYRRSPNIKYFIDINAVPEFNQYELTEDSLTLGGGISLTEAMEIFQEAAKQPGFEYCQQLWNHFDLIANVPVRNASTLAGNLLIKHQHKEFPSDVYILLEALHAVVVINESPTEQKILTIAEFLKTSLTKKVIESFVLRSYPRERYIFDSYKIMPRAQNSHAYVNAAFLLGVDGLKKVQTARICFGHISEEFVHAKATEGYLIGKSLFDAEVASQALHTLHKELKAREILPEPSPEYREKLALGLFYKFLLAHAPVAARAPKLASGGQLLKRPVSSGVQKFESFPQSSPIAKPTNKLEGLIQTAGEARYANDMPRQVNEVWAAFVTGKKVGATVTKVDTSEAMKLPGVMAYLSASDIPGKNSMVTTEPFFFPDAQELLAADVIKFYNQPIGIIVADSNALVQRAAELVKVTYAGGSAEVLPTLKSVLNSASADRINHKVKSMITELKITEPYDITGSGKLDMGLQYHFYLEPQTTVALPLDGTLQVHASTQWMDLTQDVIANLLRMSFNEVQIKVRRIGGGYGGKATGAIPVACAAALAAYKLNRPVRFVQSLESIMDTQGKRWPFYCEYDFHAQKSGKIVAIRNNFYHNAGCTSNEPPMMHAVLLSKNCYMFSDNFKLDGHMVATDSPSNISCRAPGSIEGIAMIENIVEHIAFEANLDPVDVRLANLIPGHKMEQMLPAFVESTQYKQRKQATVAFNKENRWRKRGLGLAVMEYHIGYFGQFPATVAVYHGDGSVIITHGGIEMGQGMNTKIAQVAAHTLGIPVDMIKFETSDTVNGANSMVTGGSIGSETICYAVRKCCNTLNERMKGIKEELKDASWPQVVEEAYNRKVNLIVSDDCKQGDMEPYTVCGVCITEVEVDILTGSYLLTRVDIIEDAGESLNPSVDIGQIEGAYIMGLGYWTSEQIIVDKNTGEVLTNRSWNYKPPGAKDIPIDFRIEMSPNSAHGAGFMRSKATGEPSICLAVAVVFALQQAVQSARDDAGQPKTWVTLSAPMTPEHILLNVGTDVSMLKLK